MMRAGIRKLFGWKGYHVAEATGIQSELANSDRRRRSDPLVVLSGFLAGSVIAIVRSRAQPEQRARAGIATETRAKRNRRTAGRENPRGDDCRATSDASTGYVA